MDDSNVTYSAWLKRDGSASGRARALGSLLEVSRRRSGQTTVYISEAFYSRDEFVAHNWHPQWERVAQFGINRNVRE